MAGIKDLWNAFRREKVARVSERMHAVLLIRCEDEEKKMRSKEVADLFGRSEEWVRKWVRRFEDGGVGNFGDRPRSGRPRRCRKGRWTTSWQRRS